MQPFLLRTVFCFLKNSLNISIFHQIPDFYSWIFNHKRFNNPETQPYSCPARRLLGEIAGKGSFPCKFSNNELVTVKYSIQKVIGLKEEKPPVGLGSEQVLLMVQADVLGGIDLAAMSTNDVQVAADGSVTAKLPPPKVMHVYVDEKQTRVWDRSKTWWTPWVGYDPELEQKARLAALEAVQAAALEMGILSNAQENAEKTIGKFLLTTGVESVHFERAPGGSSLGQ